MSTQSRASLKGFSLKIILALLPGTALGMTVNPPPTLELNETSEDISESFDGSRCPAVVGPATDEPTGENAAFYRAMGEGDDSFSVLKVPELLEK